LRRLGNPDPRALAAAAAGGRWLMGVQNRDGGVPTFCRGWGTLPFDRSTPEITAHALQAWSVWYADYDPGLQKAVRESARRALTFLATTQRDDGTWIPLWFGNEDSPARTTLPTERPASCSDSIQRCVGKNLEPPSVAGALSFGCWTFRTPMEDGGSGGVRSSIEETGVVLAALRHSVELDDR
jgi:squalene-hopene/tetraprenyl-beta-curcumene cyclase